MKKHKIYELIGRAVVYMTGYVGAVAVTISLLNYVVCNCITTIR